MRALWDCEREQILEVLGLEINPRAWSTAALVEEIRDCIEGRRMLVSVPPIRDAPVSSAAKATLGCEVSREEVEDWLNDIPRCSKRKYVVLRVGFQSISDRQEHRRRPAAPSVTEIRR
jgi:hypothetical protein